MIGQDGHPAHLRAERETGRGGIRSIILGPENRRFVHQADALRMVPAAVRFISAEPLLGPLEGLNLDGIDWLIAGGESGPRHRRVDIGWIRDLRDACNDEDVAFFFKQWGGHRPKSNGRDLDGRRWDEYPTQADRRSVVTRLRRSARASAALM
jgi:protein gp37